MDEIVKAKERTWRDFMSKANKTSIYDVNKYLNAYSSKNTQIQTIPTLDEEAESDEQMPSALQQTFFPPLPAADLPSQYPRTKYAEQSTK